jgi:hypothetical protein
LGYCIMRKFDIYTGHAEGLLYASEIEKVQMGHMVEMVERQEMCALF